jgi:hypothetical protein
MGGIVKMPGAPTFRFVIVDKLEYEIPVTGPFGEVTGHGAAPAVNLSQDVVDRTAASFQAFYDALPEDQQGVIATLIVQSMEAQDRLWPE